MENKKPTWSVNKTENKTQIWRRSKIPLVAIFIAGILLGAVVVYSQIPAQSLTISGGIYPSEVTYTIFAESGNYYAKSATGSIDYYGTNASAVFQNSITALGVNGGRIFAKSGNYTISTTLSPQSDNVWIEGENMANTDAGAFGTVLTATANVSIFNATGASYSALKHFTLKNLYLKGYEGYATVVYAKFTYSLLIERVHFWVGWGYGVLVDQCEMASIRLCEFHDIGKTAIAFSTCSGGEIYGNNIYYVSSVAGAGIDVHCNDILIHDNYVADSYGQGIKLYHCERAVISRNVIKDVGQRVNNTINAIHIDESDYGLVSDNVVLQTASPAPSGDHWAMYGIYLGALSDYNLVTDNIVRISFGTSSYHNDGTGNAFHDNMLNDTWTP